MFLWLVSTALVMHLTVTVASVAADDDADAGPIRSVTRVRSESCCVMAETPGGSIPGAISRSGEFGKQPLLPAPAAPPNWRTTREGGSV